jgi:hypothetical protein
VACVPATATAQDARGIGVAWSPRVVTDLR